MRTHDTIVAPATPYGYSGLAIVRLSGENALAVTLRLTNRKKGAFKARSAVFSSIYSAHNKKPFDDAVITFFSGPKSYTGEDLVEISCHGSPAVVEEIIYSTIQWGARLAEPGEFTRRAFLNGKMDLTQAESVASMINSQSLESSRLSYQILHGALSEKFTRIKTDLVNLISIIEFELDISEAEAAQGLAQKLKGQLSLLRGSAESLLKTYRQGKLLTSGAKVVITGKPNVGKSTLLNALSNTARAITSPQPGTTRDAVDVSLLINGVPLRLVDTAGIRTAQDEIEKEGVRRTRTHIEEADLILSVVDAPHEDYFSHPSIPVLKVFNKTDLFPEVKTSSSVINISAKRELGLETLKENIKTHLGISAPLSSEALLISSRQESILTDLLENLRGAAALVSASGNLQLEIIALELRSALEAVDRILGKTTADDILDNIFGSFCVGK